MKLQLISLSLINFKGVRSLDVNFQDITRIDGDNGTGKTTVFDAFNWLLFGKDSKDRKDFNIKTLDSENNPLHKLDHEVTGVLSVDGHHIELKRVYREKWVKKRGSNDSEMAGHETVFFYNQVPLSQQEYNAKIDSIIKEDLAKLLTNPLYFNTLKWQERRGVLANIAGTVSDQEVFTKITTDSNRDDVTILAGILSSGKSLDEYKRELGAKKKKIKDELEHIPARIDEADRSKPDAADYDYIQSQIVAKTDEIAAIESSINDKSKAVETIFNQIQEKHNQVNVLRGKVRDLQRADEDKKYKTIQQYDENIRKDNNNILTIEGEISSLETQVRTNKKLIEEGEKNRETLKTDWTNLNEQTVSITDHDTSCPACQREFDPNKVEEIKNKLSTNFNEDKVRRLNDMNKRGTEINDRIKIFETQNGELEEKILQKRKDIQYLNVQITAQKDGRKQAEAAEYEPSPEIETLTKEIDVIEASIPERPTVDTTELTDKKRILSTELDELKKQLSTKDQITKINQRIAELEKQESEMSQSITDIERWEFLMASFSKAKIDEIERRVNGKFQFVKFKMFDTQINGGETECCECLVNGVPYSDVNTAGKINAGVDILNVLMNHYGMSTPVWIDNRESINNILPCNSQIINLTVSNNKQLTIQ